MANFSKSFNVRNRRVKDYSFTIGFFALFSLFVFFAIRPNLTTAFTLEKELKQLQETDQSYEDAIAKIVALQSLMQQYRDDFPLLDEAVPPSPQVSKVIDDVTKTASAAGLNIKKLNINKVSLKDSSNKNDQQSYTLFVESNDDFSKARNFMTLLLSQRRLKTLKNINITKDVSEGSGSAKLRIQFEVNGYYL